MPMYLVWIWVPQWQRFEVACGSEKKQIAEYSRRVLQAYGKCTVISKFPIAYDWDSGAQVSAVSCDILEYRVQ